jgi:hypothetical protein
MMSVNNLNQYITYTGYANFISVSLSHFAKTDLQIWDEYTLDLHNQLLIQQNNVTTVVEEAVYANSRLKDIRHVLLKGSA